MPEEPPKPKPKSKPSSQKGKKHNFPKNPQSVPVTCKKCGKEFRVSRSRFARGNVTYCSQACRSNAAKINQPMLADKDYEDAKTLAQWGVPDYRIARALGFHEYTVFEKSGRPHEVSPAFSKYIYSDPALFDAIVDGYLERDKIVIKSAMRQAIDRYQTICRECGKIAEGSAVFLPSCPYCDMEEEDPHMTGPGGVHTKVKHKLVRGNVIMNIFLLKAWLGFRDKVEISGDEDNPVVVATLADFVKARANRYETKE